MREDEAEQVAAGLQARGIMAKVARPSSFRFGIRIPLPDGREVLWDVDGAAGLEVLVGFVPQIPGSGDFDVPRTIAAIAAADYGPDPTRR
jgi:hypothetical protein